MIDLFMDLQSLTCCKCAARFAIDQRLYAGRLQDHESFWCPNGHPQHFISETPDQKRVREAEAALEDAQVALRRSQQQRDSAWREVKGKTMLLGKEKAKRARIEARVAHGVCPCCKRTFAALARHMTAKHPDWQQRKRPTKQGAGP